MALAARLGPIADGDGRQVERNRLRLDASIGSADAGAIDVVVHDLSVHGFLAQTASTLPVGSQVWLELTRIGRVAAKIRWRGSSTIGCEFDEPIEPNVLAATLHESRVVRANFPASKSIPKQAPATVPRTAAPAAGKAAPAAKTGRWSFAKGAVFIFGASILLWSIVIVALRTIWAAFA
jgi:hypothetical protein